ncbi:hypothetical protein [Gemmata obscuriglobus]|uniref:hypothetical protein n=1 Tax=Gemmata obscuriglobus TaxID=114 RepID=UPI0020121816|nr:hypothetical protein [Gemmata obscuriglobus]
MPVGRTLLAVGLVLGSAAVLLALKRPAGTPAPAAAGATTTTAAAPGPFKLEKGDHVCIIGNTLADRMQHDGWVETFLYARNPDLDLTVRNLGYSGDEPGLRLRSEDFGTPDQWLAAKAPVPKPNLVADKSVVNPNRFEKAGTNADVIFAFFGYNESWAGEAGLPKFKSDLEAFVKHTLAQKYNGKSAPRQGYARIDLGQGAASGYVSDSSFGSRRCPGHWLSGWPSYRTRGAGTVASTRWWVC